MEVLVNTYIDSLREEDGRAINHHGRTINVATVKEGKPAAGGDGNKKEVQNRVLPITAKDIVRKTFLVMNGRNQCYVVLNIPLHIFLFPLIKIARNEHSEVRARQEYYSGELVVEHVRRMRLAVAMAKVGFPVFYVLFLFVFFVVGIGHYNDSSMLGGGGGD